MPVKLTAGDEDMFDGLTDDECILLIKTIQPDKRRPDLSCMIKGSEGSPEYILEALLVTREVIDSQIEAFERQVIANAIFQKRQQRSHLATALQVAREEPTGDPN